MVLPDLQPHLGVAVVRDLLDSSEVRVQFVHHSSLTPWSVSSLDFLECLCQQASVTLRERSENLVPWVTGATVASDPATAEVVAVVVSAESVVTCLSVYQGEVLR